MNSDNNENKESQKTGRKKFTPVKSEEFVEEAKERLKTCKEKAKNFGYLQN